MRGRRVERPGPPPRRAVKEVTSIGTSRVIAEVLSDHFAPSAIWRWLRTTRVAGGIDRPISIGTVDAIQMGGLSAHGLVGANGVAGRPCHVEKRLNVVPEFKDERDLLLGLQLGGVEKRLADLLGCLVQVTAATL